MVLESIRFWVNDFQGQDEIVIMAIDEMLKNGAKNYNYLDKVLKSWENKQLDTVEKVRKYLRGITQNHLEMQAKRLNTRNLAQMNSCLFERSH